MARNEWNGDWGYGGEYQERGWTPDWRGRHRDDWDRENRWMNQRVGWSGQTGYGDEYTGGGWQPRRWPGGEWQGADWNGGWNGPRWGGDYEDAAGRWRRGRQGGRGSRSGTEPGTRRRPWGGWSGRASSRDSGWGWNRDTMGRGGSMGRPAGYGSSFQGPGYGGEYLGRSRGARRRDYGRPGGYAGERPSGRGSYYGGEYGW